MNLNSLKELLHIEESYDADLVKEVCDLLGFEVQPPKWETLITAGIALYWYCHVFGTTTHSKLRTYIMVWTWNWFTRKWQRMGGGIVTRTNVSAFISNRKKEYHISSTHLTYLLYVLGSFCYTVVYSKCPIVNAIRDFTSLSCPDRLRLYVLLCHYRG